jgi:hypothetical protein
MRDSQRRDGEKGKGDGSPYCNTAMLLVLLKSLYMQEVKMVVVNHSIGRARNC